MHVFAAILLFRVIYRLAPVLTAAVLFAANEVALRREEVGGLLHGLHRRSEPAPPADPPHDP